MNLFGLFSKKPPEHKGSGTDIQFKNHNPESKVLFVYNLMNKGLHDLNVIIFDSEKNEFRVKIEKISVRSTYEISLDKLVDINNTLIINPLSTISILYNDQTDKFRVNDDGKILRVR
jgi:hypothetical protein